MAVLGFVFHSLIDGQAPRMLPALYSSKNCCEHLYTSFFVNICFYFPKANNRGRISGL